MINEMQESSKEIVERAILEYQPYAIVSMISGGKDSMCAYQVAKNLSVPITHILHGITGTGIPETTEFVRNFSQTQPYTYIEADAGDAYEKYVLRKGFFGVGISAHAFTYHILKREHFDKCVSHNIRQRKRNRNVLLLNGARASESLNRSKNMLEPITQKGRNIWVDVLHYWSREDRDDYLDSVKVPTSPVTETLCRSGECLCGTTQSKETRREASFFYPKWGDWIDSLEQEVRNRGFDWGWGDTMTKKSSLKVDKIPDFQPMCVGCLDDFDRLIKENTDK